MKPKTILLMLSIAQFLAMQVWFNFSAVMPVIEKVWGISSAQSGLIIAFFHIGYVVSIIITSMFIDKYNPKYFIVFGALLAGISGIAFTLYAGAFWTTLLLRMLSGIGIAGIYVPGMKIITQVFEAKDRGSALGIYVGSLVVGSGFSLFLSGLLIDTIGWKGVITLTSCFSLIACLIVVFMKVPSKINETTITSFQWSVIKKVFKKKNLLVNGGYAGHTWELYSMWAWIGPFLVFYFSTKGYSQIDAIQYGNLLGAIVIMIGGFATFVGGKLSDTYGRVKTANLFLIVSITCSICIGWFLSLPLFLMLILVVVYGFTIVADSPVYNVALTEIADPEVLGLALGVQNILGFSTTIISPFLFGVLLQSYNWGVAFSVIGIITIIAPSCMFLLGKIQKQKVNEELL